MRRFSKSIFLNLRQWLILLILFPLLSAAQQYFGDPAGIQSFRDSSIGRALLSPTADLSSLLKREDELNTYFACYLADQFPTGNQAQTRLREFNEVYRPFLEEARQHFQIPYAMSSCMMFRETIFNNDAVSPANAQTIAQFTPDTYTTILNNIRLVRGWEDDYQEYQRLSQQEDFDVLSSRLDNEYIKCLQFSQRDGWWTTQVSRAELINSHNTCRTQLNNFRIHRPLAQQIQTYLWSSSRNMNDETYARYFNTPRSQGWPRGDDLLPPSSFSRLKNNPMWLMAINMYYIRNLLDGANARFNPQGFQRSEDYLGYLAVIAGAYNQGPGNLFDVVDNPNGSIEQWCRRLAQSPETRNYMLSIKRCMVQGSNHAMTNMNRNDQCGPAEGEQRNIDDPCEVIYASGDGRVYDLRDPAEPVVSPAEN